MNRPLVKDIPQREQLLSERYRIAADAWVKALVPAGAVQ